MRVVTLCSFLVLTLPSCGSRLDSGPSNRVQLVKTSDAGAATSVGACPISAPPQSLLAKGFTKQNINALSVTSQYGRSKSLCDYLTDMDSRVAIVQFSGVTCLSCQEEAKFFTSKLNLTNVYGNKIMHVVALTDLMSDYQEEDFARFMKTYAPNSLRTHDPDTYLWRYFSVDKNEPTRPTIIAFNRYGWTYVINSASHTKQELLDQAKILEAATPDQPDPSTIGQNSDSDKATPVPVEPQPTWAPLPTGQPAPTTIPTLSSVPTPTPSSPSSSKPAVTLTSSQNMALIGGSSGETISSFFGDSNYLLIDLSQYNCGYCRDLADQHQSDPNFQNAMQSGKCVSLTVVPSSDVSSWQRAYPTSTYIGKTSRGVSNESSLARAFGVSFQGTPTVFMVDRNGTVIDSAVGEFPSKVSSLCY